jgi:predicted lactoylglutathione lyase
MESTYRTLVTGGIKATPPFDHGFAVVTTFHDPDGNNIEVMQPAQ